MRIALIKLRYIARVHRVVGSLVRGKLEWAVKSFYRVKKLALLCKS